MKKTTDRSMVVPNDEPGGMKLAKRLKNPNSSNPNPKRVHLKKTRVMPRKKHMIPGALSFLVNSLIVLDMPMMKTRPVRKRKLPV